MFSPRLLLFTAAMGSVALAAPSWAQAPSPASAGGRPPEVEFDLGLVSFVRDATTFTALPWQQDVLGLTAVQAAELRAVAAPHLAAVQELYLEIRTLFETVALLDRPIDAHEAFALYYDIAAHKAEALIEFHAGAELMLAVLTDEQRAQWEQMLEDAAWELGRPAWGNAELTAPHSAEPP